MPSREELHTLVDSLPEAALEAASQMLTRLQVWPPRVRPSHPAWSGLNGVQGAIPGTR